MSTKILFHDNQGLNRSVEVVFTSEKQANDFIQTYQNTGGFTRFLFDIHEIDNGRHIHDCQSSLVLYKALYKALYEKSYSWVNKISYYPQTKTGHEHIAGFDKVENPMHVKVLEFFSMETYFTHVTNIKPGDTIIVNGQDKTVCAKDIKYDSFMGTSIFGYNYKSGHELVEVVNYPRFYKGERI